VATTLVPATPSASRRPAGRSAPLAARLVR
jgi:hypothetical protein